MDTSCVRKSCATSMDEALDSMVEGADKQGAPKRLSTLPADADSKYEVDVNKLCTELASNEVEDDCDIVHENFLMAIYFIGKTGAGKSTLINILLGIAFEFINQPSSDLSPEELQLFEESGCEMDMVQTLTVKQRVPNSPEMGDGLESVTDRCTVYTTDSHRGILLVDTPGFDDSKGVHVDTLHSLRMARCIRQHERLVVALVIPVNDIMSYKERTHLKNNESFLVGISSFMKDNPDKFTSLRLFLNKFSAPDQPKKEIMSAYAALKSVITAINSGGDINPKIKPVIEHMMQQIMKSLTSGRFGELVIVPAGRSPTEERVVDTHRNLMWEVLESMPSISPDCVGLALNPEAIAAIENACVKFHAEIQTLLQSPDGADATGIYERLGDLQLLYLYAEIPQVYEQYRNSVKAIADFVTAKFQQAETSLKQNEYKSASDYLRSAGSLHVLQRFSRDHPNGNLAGISRLWQKTQHTINTAAETIHTDIVEHRVSYAAMCVVLSRLQDISEGLRGFLKEGNVSCFDDAIAHLRNRINHAFEHANELVEQQRFRGEDLYLAMETLEEVQCFSPRFIDEAHRLHRMTTTVTGILSNCVHDFTAHSVSLLALVCASTYGSSQRALTIIDDVCASLKKYLPVDTLAQGSVCQHTYVRLRDEAMQFFRHTLKAASAVAMDPTMPGDSDEWKNTMSAFANVYLVCKLRLRDETSTTVLQEATNLVFGDIRAICTRAEDVFPVEHESEMNIHLAGHLTVQLDMARQAISDALHASAQKDLLTDLRAVIADVEATLTEIGLRVAQRVATITDTATISIKAADVQCLADVMDMLESFCANGLVQHASAVHPQQGRPTVTASIVQLLLLIAAHVRTTCKDSDAHADQLSRFDVLPDTQVEETARQFETLQQYHVLMTHLACAAPTLATVKDGDTYDVVTMGNTPSTPATRFPNDGPPAYAQHLTVNDESNSPVYTQHQEQSAEAIHPPKSPNDSDSVGLRDAMNVFTLHDRTIGTSHDRLCAAVLSYASRCLQRCAVSLSNSDVADVQCMLHTLEGCSLALDKYCADEHAIHTILQDAQQSVRQEFEDTLQSAKAAILVDDLGTADKSIRRLHVMEPLEILFTEMSIRNAVLQVSQEYQGKHSSFAGNVRDAFNFQRFDEVAKLLLGSTDVDGPEGNQCATCKNEISTIIRGRINTAKRLVDTAAHTDDGTLPQDYQLVADVLQWVESASPLAAVFPMYARDIQLFHQHIQEFLQTTFHRGVSDAERFHFHGALSAQRFLREHLRLCILPDEAKDFLSELDAALQKVVDTLASQLDTMLRSDAISIRVANDLDRLFDGMHSILGIQPQTNITRIIAAEYRSLQNKLYQVLRTYCTDAKEAYLNYNLEDGIDCYERLKVLMVSRICQNLLHDNEDHGIPFLQRMQRDTIEQMFHPSWVKGGTVDDRKEKMHALRILLPDQYRRCVTHFVDEHVTKPSQNIIQQLQSAAYTAHEVKRVSHLFDVIPIYATVFESHESMICEALHEVDTAFVDKVGQAKLDTHIKLRGSDVDGAVSQIAPFLKLAPIVLARAMSLQGSADGGWRQRFKSSQSDSLANDVETFMRERLRADDDGSDIERDWNRLVRDSTIDTITQTDVLELSKYVTMLRTDRDLLVRMTQLASHVSYDNAVKELDRKFGASVLTRAAEGMLDKVDLPALTALLHACGLLQRVDEPALTDVFAKANNDVRAAINGRISILEEQSSEQFSNSMSTTISTEEKNICIAKVNTLMEQRDKLAEVCNQDRTGSKAIDKIKEASTTMKKEAMAFISSTTAAGDDSFHMRVADYLVTLYEAPAAMSNEDVKAHAHKCNQEILTAFKRQAGSSISKLDEQLRQQELGHEIVDGHSVFSRTRMEKLKKAMATLSDDAAIQKMVSLNKLDEDGSSMLHKCWAQYHTAFTSTMSRVHRDGPSGVAKVALSDFCASRRGSRENIVQLIAKVCAVWSLEKSPRDGGEVSVFLQPHAAQVLAIFRLLQLDGTESSSLFSALVKRVLEKFVGDKAPPNHLTQVKTGQGKSVILGVTATVLGVMGYSVDCACYSKYLSERDLEDFVPIFNHFKMLDRVEYGTFQQLAARLTNKKGDVRELTRQLCRSGSRRGASSGPVRTPRKRDRVLLIDEVDVFFSIEFYGNTYDPIALIRGPEVSALMHMIWNNRNTGVHHIVSKVHNSEEFKTLIAGVGADIRRHRIIRDQIEHCVGDLQDFLAHPQPVDRVEQQYKVVDGKICYKTIDTVSSDIDFGYRTLWAYFKEHADNPESVPKESVEEHIALQIACGQFSYAEAPKEYSVILGVTGTLEQSLGLPFQRKVLEKEYNISQQTLMPSMFGDSKLDFKERDHVFVEKDTDTYYRKIQEEVKQNSDLGRPVLVYFESETALREWRDSTYGQASFTEGVVASITAATPNIDHYIQRASRSTMVTLLSREHGRGLDFKNTSDQVDALKGIHIVQTFFSEEPSEEVQIQGRTARMGKNGTYVLVLQLAHLDKFAVTEEDVDNLSRGGDETMYAHMCKKRQVRLEANAKTREAAAEAALVLHTQSKQYQKHLLAAQRGHFADNDKLTPCFTYLQSLNGVARKCRLVCLSDATGSMDALWNAARGQFTEMLRRIAEISGSSSEIEIQWVAYRDYDCEGRPQAPLIEASGWTADASALVRFVGKILCRGGGDYEEAIEAALAFVNDLDHTPSRVLLFGDAPPHPETTGQHLAYHHRTMTTDYVQECNKLMAKSTPVPVYTFYMSGGAQASFEHIAALTGGQAESLDSKRLQSGDAKQLLDAVCLQALQEIGGEALTRVYKAKYRV